MSTGCAGTASSRPRTIARARKRLKDCGYEPKIAISGSEIAGKRGRRVGRLLHVALCLAKLSSGTNQPNGEGLRGQCWDSLFLRSLLKCGVGRCWRPLQTEACNRPRPNPRKQHLTERRIVQRLRRLVRTWIVRPLMLHRRLRGVEFFRASSLTNRGIVCSKTRRYSLQTHSDLRERPSRR